MEHSTQDAGHVYSWNCHTWGQPTYCVLVSTCCQILPPDCFSPDFQLTLVFKGTFPPCLIKSMPGTLKELSKRTCACRSATGGGQVSRMTGSASKNQAQRKECGMECRGRGIFLDIYHLTSSIKRANSIDTKTSKQGRKTYKIRIKNASSMCSNAF